MIRALTAATLAGLLCMAGCAGCEEPDDSSGSSSAPAAQSGGAQGSNAGGASEVATPGSMKPAAANTGPRDQSRFDTDKGAGKTNALGQAGETAQQTNAPLPPLAQAPRVRPVAADKLMHVLGRAPAGRYALVFEYKAGCRDCEVLAPVISSLVEEQAASFDFYGVDLTSVNTTTSTTLPIMLMYEGAKQTSALAGMPFPRDTVKIDGKPETDLSYRKRLRRWLQDALSSRDLLWSKR